MSDIWVEKYRPQVLNDITGNDAAISRLKSIALHGNMPNLIITGPPGTGKTTSVLCLARELLGPAFPHAVLELNASDDRGIDVVRNKIKMFAQQKVTLPPNRHKIVILDEADSMTSAAQQALRRTMELYSSTTRFAFACNQSAKIIEPLQSRCAILRYQKISSTQVLSRLLHICAQEGIPYDTQGIETLLYVVDGDLRHGINVLQSCYAGFGSITEKAVLSISDVPAPVTCRRVLESCGKGEWREGWDKVEGLCEGGFTMGDVLGGLYRVVKTEASISEEKKLLCLKEIALIQWRTADNNLSLIAMQALLASFCNILA